MSANSKNPTASVKPKFVMPTPPPVVVWRSAIGAEATHAIVTQAGRTAISVMLFPPDSRGGIPKDSVRYIGDPMLKAQPNFESGVWDYTDETKLLRVLAKIVIPASDGNVAPTTPEMIEFVNRVTK